MRANARTTRWVEIALGGITVVMLTIGVTALVRSRSSTRSTEGGEPIRHRALEGRRLGRLQLGSEGGSHVLYVFLTTCRYCELQRRHIGRELARLDPARVATASQESTRLTQHYWRAQGVDLAPPGVLSPEAAEELALPGVPALVFLRADNTVASVYVGTAFAWDARRIEAELQRAADRAPTMVSGASR